MKFKIKIGDKVKVISGKFKNKEGIVKKINKNSSRVIVDGIFQIKHKKPNQNEKGEIKKIARPIDISNIMLFDPKGSVLTRVGYKFDKNNKKIRFSKKTKKEYIN